MILDGHRIEVNKEKLANKSRYFSSLFSHNFNDSHNKEHVINYDVSLETLQSFVDWVQDDKECVDMYCHSIKDSMTKFVKDNFLELLNLLQLSVLFMVDELTNDAIDIVALRWLLPEKVIDVWLVAQELNEKPLQDICLSVCLDRFGELPLHSLVELSKDNITQLLQNANVRSSVDYLCFVRLQWIEHHMTSDIADIIEERRPKFMQGVVIYQMEEFINKDAYLYTWNGSVLSKCVQLRNTRNSEKWIIGMQVVGRGFSVYTVGGEIGLGTGQFNQIIWRYCLILKKWYYQATLPVPRRHMVTVFLKEKLVIVGGVGRHRLKLYTVDTLDIHTGKWTKGAEVPESFTEVPCHCVMDGKLFLIKTSAYIYYSEQDYWQTILIRNLPLYNIPCNPAIKSVDAVLTRHTTLFATGYYMGETILSRIDIVKDSVCEQKECLNQCTEHNIITNVTIIHEDESCQLKYGYVLDCGVMFVTVRPDDKYRYLHLYTEVKRDFKDSFISKSGYPSIIDPDTLRDTV